jgi:beta-glucosidase
VDVRRGLSYTTVEYSALGLVSSALGADDTIIAEVTVANTGSAQS